MQIQRRDFIRQMGVLSLSYLLLPLDAHGEMGFSLLSVDLPACKKSEDIISYIIRVKGKFDIDLYRKILGAANYFKEGDWIANLSAKDNASRKTAKKLIGNTPIKTLTDYPVYEDQLYGFITESTQAMPAEFQEQTFSQFKKFLLSSSASDIHSIMPTLSSDQIAVVVKLCSNEELIQISKKVFNPIPGTQIGSQGYMGARVQPNSPTDNPEDVFWQVMDAWSYAVGDVVLGTNPVSSLPEDVARLESTLFDILQTFGLEDTMPHCVLAHIDVQAEVEKRQPNSTGIWFQSIAGTDAANATFDVSVDKMKTYAASRKGRYGLYAETGQGADETNGHGAGFDMLLHKSRKYGFHRGLKAMMTQRNAGAEPWVIANDVAGFIGPEVFRTKEQLVRCCLEDLVMGKLHGLTLGLDVCTTLHMDVSLEDLSWCLDEIMPANPAYLMALPTQNDPMLSYLTTSFSDHLRIREKFDYKVNDAMWAFFKTINVITADGKSGLNFGRPQGVYVKYKRAKGDNRSEQEIIEEANRAIAQVRMRGVPIAEGHGAQFWEMEPKLSEETHALYADAKYCLWQDFSPELLQIVPSAIPLITQSQNRTDYVYHPASGEVLNDSSLRELQAYLETHADALPQLQIVISDGLNIRSLLDSGHLHPFLELFQQEAKKFGFSLGSKIPVIQYGRVRAGYQCGKVLFGKHSNPNQVSAIIHIIGERPGSAHRNFSVYITSANASAWAEGTGIDHNITKVVSGISDTALTPEHAVKNIFEILQSQFEI